MYIEIAPKDIRRLPVALATMEESGQMSIEPPRAAQQDRTRRACVALIAGTALGWTGYSAQSAIIVKKRFAPAVSAAPVVTKPSKVELYLNVPLAKITAIANAYAFQLQNSGSSFGVQYDVTVIPDKLKLEASGDEHHQLVLTGNFRFAGYASQRPMKGNGTATVKVGINIGPNWCPVVELARPEIEWKAVEAPFLVKFAIDSGLINNAIASELSKIAECGLLKRQLATLWQQATVPVLAADPKSKRNAMFLNVNPQNISIRDLGVAKGRLTATIAVGAQISLDQQAAKKRELILPDPMASPGDNDHDEDVRAIVRGNLGLSPP
jgi:hypothetical protein